MSRRRPRLPKSPLHLLVAALVLLTQAAGVGFCGGEAGLSHSSGAHFHVGSLLDGDNPCGHRHESDDPASLDDGPGHDDDAIYVAFEAAPTVQVRPVFDVTVTGVWDVAVPPAATETGLRLMIAILDPSPPDCPIFLRHCALLN